MSHICRSATLARNSKVTLTTVAPTSVPSEVMQKMLEALPSEEKADLTAEIQDEATEPAMLRLPALLVALLIFDLIL